MKERGEWLKGKKWVGRDWKKVEEKRLRCDGRAELVLLDVGVVYV